jgi:hypothetical protein
LDRNIPTGDKDQITNSVVFDGYSKICKVFQKSPKRLAKCTQKCTYLIAGPHIYLIFYYGTDRYGPEVDSASNRNEYQEYFLEVKAAGV